MDLTVSAWWLGLQRRYSVVTTSGTTISTHTSELAAYEALALHRTARAHFMRRAASHAAPFAHNV